MKLTPSFALTGYVAAGALLIGFGGGWYVQGLRWSASLHKELKTAVRKQEKQQARVEHEATTYETERTHATERSQRAETEIRTIFKDRVVPGDCAAPDAARRVLEQAVAAANSLASGEPRDELPSPSASSGPADRPREDFVGSGDDSPLWGLRIETSSRSPGLAEITPAFAHPSPTRDEPGND